MDHGGRRAGGAALALVLIVLATVSCSSSDPASTGPVTRTDKRPNVVVVMTDDQMLTDMQFLAKTKDLIGAKGTTFANNFATFPLCCPSRATSLTGQYAHNHHVLNNVPPDGGNDKLDHTTTMPVWLQQAGYNTAHVGKYLNGYGEESAAVVPPGYTDWFGLIDPSVLQFWDYDVLDNGTKVHFGDADSDYQTDVLATRASDDIKKFVQQDKPFYLSVWPLAPHSATGKGAPNPLSPAPAPRHRGTYATLTYPHGPSFMEPDVSDKPPAVQVVKDKIAEGLENLHIDAAGLNDLIDETYRARAESLLAVDDLVAKIVDTLGSVGQLDNTIIVFTSDNGWLLGEHGIPFAKVVLYEEAVRVPLLVRGPGFPAGATATQPVANIDLAATIAARAGAKPTIPVDGIDLTPLAADPAVQKNRAILLEEFSQKPGYKGVRVPGFMYAEYADGSAELYDLFKDPLELESKDKDPAFAKTKARLSKALAALADCAAATCQVEVPQAELRG